jgi:hypothetical protein
MYFKLPTLMEILPSTSNWGGYGAGNPYGADIIEPGAFSDFDYDAVGVGGGVPYRAEIMSIKKGHLLILPLNTFIPFLTVL